MNIRSTLSGIVNNWKGWKTKRKIIVLESDDWGSVRMPSKKAFNTLLQKGIKADKCPFMRLDTIASPNDLENLFETFRSIRDSNGHSLQLTANTIVANPDFIKIRESNFEEYFFENFQTSIERIYPRGRILDLWNEGISQKLFFPQLHGREHVNYNRWLSDLRKKDPQTVIAFNEGVYGISTNSIENKRESYLASFDFDEKDQELEAKKIINDAAQMFNNAFGYFSSSFIAPNYIWSEDVEKNLLNNNIIYIQSSKSQLYPAYIRTNGTTGVMHNTGQINANGQIYLVRNCVFEPSINNADKALKNCISQIQMAFLMGKPAIVASHRLNYVGALVENNRIHNLAALKRMFSVVKEKWPDVEFLNSSQLGNIIANEH